MKIIAESNCVRMSRRLTSPMSVSVGDQVFSARNWSTGGVLVAEVGTALERGRVDAGELLMPCSDGMYVLAVQLMPVHLRGGDAGCRFVDMPPRERGALHFYADRTIEGGVATIAEVEAAARVAKDTTPQEVESKTAPAAATPAWRQSLFRLPKRILVVGGLLAMILVIAALTIPSLREAKWMRGLTRQQFLELAGMRWEAERDALAGVESTIAQVGKILAGQLQGHIQLDGNQIKLYQQGLQRLERERDELTKRVRSIEAEKEKAVASRFFVPNPLSDVYKDPRPDPVPFITLALQDNAVLAGSAPVVGTAPQPVDAIHIEKYTRVAEARLREAELALESTKVRRNALNKILERVAAAGPEGGFPLNQQELMTRDAQLLELEETRLEAVMVVLRDNLESVRSGNFIYETKLLERFDVESEQSVDTAADNHLLD